MFIKYFLKGADVYLNLFHISKDIHNISKYRDKISSIERAAPKSWSEYTTEDLKLEKLIK